MQIELAYPPKNLSIFPFKNVLKDPKSIIYCMFMQNIIVNC